MIDRVARVSLERSANESSPDPIWLNYWNGYRADRRVIEEESQDYVTHLLASLQLDSKQTVLDFGCGSGVAARLLASHVDRICLWDAARSAQELARVNVADIPNAELIDLTDQSRDPAHVFDVILSHSVVQYMSVPELETWVRRWAAMLSLQGVIVLSDMPGPESGFVPELTQFLAFALRRGILLPALRQGFREISGYRAAAGVSRLMRVDPSLLERISSAAGLYPEWLPRNLTYRRQRLSIVLRKRGPSQA